MVERYGASSYIHGQLHDGTELLVHQEGQSTLKRGDLLQVLLRQGHWHLFGDDGLRLQPLAGGAMLVAALMSTIDGDAPALEQRSAWASEIPWIT